jgi:hypothetical protein
MTNTFKTEDNNLELEPHTGDWRTCRKTGELALLISEFIIEMMKKYLKIWLIKELF